MHRNCIPQHGMLGLNWKSHQSCRFVHCVFNGTASLWHSRILRLEALMASILQAPFKLPFTLTKLLLRLTRRPHKAQLPVAGLEQLSTHPILTALRQGSTSPEV